MPPCPFCSASLPRLLAVIAPAALLTALPTPPVATPPIAKATGALTLPTVVALVASPVAPVVVRARVAPAERPAVLVGTRYAAAIAAAAIAAISLVVAASESSYSFQPSARRHLDHFLLLIATRRIAAAATSEILKIGLGE